MYMYFVLFLIHFDEFEANFFHFVIMGVLGVHGEK